MQERSAPRRCSPDDSSPPRYKSKRVLAVVSTLIVFAAIVTVTQVSQAADRNRRKPAALPVCPPAATGKATQGADDAGKATQGADNAGKATQGADGKAADGKAADGKAADGKAADGKAADGKAADGKAADGKAADGKAADGKAADGKAADGKAADGKAADGKAADGKAADGKAADGTAADGKAADGKAAEKAPAAPPQEPGEPATGADPDAPNDGTAPDPKAGDVPEVGQQSGEVDGGVQNGKKVRHHVGDTGDGKQPSRKDCKPPSGGQNQNPGSGREGFLGNSCDESKLAKHDGFPKGNKCSSTEFGEVPAADKSPSLLITQSPSVVRTNKPFSLKVSTRNIRRDRFLPAATGGYYKESSFLTDEGIVRGHFHTACQYLSSTRVAPDPAPVPAFFVATEDGSGGTKPDTVTINIPGLPNTGLVRCVVWEGDPSHRVPMAERANQIPGVDAVRIRVVR
jgi:hypothetical protein